MMEPVHQFEERKRDHITQALKSENEALGFSGFESVELQHEALPDLNFSDVSLSTQILKKPRSSPFLVSSMTAGHTDSVDLNVRLAKACAAKGWLMGVGSQRRELFDDGARAEWKRVRSAAPNVELLGNLGLSQLVQTSNDKVKELVDALEAVAMIIHLNPLQECMQPEGTPQFRGGLARLADLSRALSVPLIVKETGCGFSPQTLQRLNESGVAAVDVSGFGGTHWGRIEGARNRENTVLAQAAQTFANWGVSTVESLVNAQKLNLNYEVWASGGVRNGLDAAKALALGAKTVGLAKPILVAALEGEEQLHQQMTTIEYELKTALFCTGCQSPQELSQKRVWNWRQKTL
jgi:isopentenyl-diphosphate delta-isomerase